MTRHPVAPRRPWPTVTIIGAALALATVVLGSGGYAWADTGAGQGSPGWGDPGSQPPNGHPDPSAWPGGPPSITALCTAAFEGPATGSLVRTTTAGPNGSTVTPGQPITATATWNPRDTRDAISFITADCVDIGSRVSTQLTQVHNPGPTGGTDHFSYTVPAEGTRGQPICDRAVIWINHGGQYGGDHALGDVGRDDRGQWGQGGDPGGTEKSAVLCYTLLGAVAPEAPAAILFPVVALMVGGGFFVVQRRRRAAARLAPEHARSRS